MASGSKKQEKRELAKITGEDLLDVEQFRWITLNKLQYVDDKGVSRDWEAAQRTTRKGDVDAVFIVANVINHKKIPDAILVISQFRPPTRTYCIEFPAGLVDEGEVSFCFPHRAFFFSRFHLISGCRDSCSKRAQRRDWILCRSETSISSTLRRSRYVKCQFEVRFRCNRLLQ